MRLFDLEEMQWGRDAFVYNQAVNHQQQCREGDSDEDEVEKIGINGY